MRLIDADRLKTVIDRNIVDGSVKDLFNQYVDIQPTAYDAEKVLEELNKSLYDTNTYGACDDIETIVKRGGIDE